MASQEGDAIVARAPYVDIVFGPQTLHRLPELMLRGVAERVGRRSMSPSPRSRSSTACRGSRVEGASAFVSIMEGCSSSAPTASCPITRGDEVSRPLADVLAEVAALTAQGVREITLLGQNVNAYRGEMERRRTADLAFLHRDAWPRCPTSSASATPPRIRAR